MRSCATSRTGRRGDESSEASNAGTGGGTLKLMAIEIMLNAANINFLAFWRYGTPAANEGPLTGVMMAIFVITIAAAEVAVIEEGRPEAGFAENDDARIDHLNGILGQVATSRGVRIVDLGAQLRSLPGGELDPSLRPDGVSFVAAAGAPINSWLLPLLRDSAPPPAPAAPAAVVAALCVTLGGAAPRCSF